MTGPLAEVRTAIKALISVGSPYGWLQPAAKARGRHALSILDSIAVVGEAELLKTILEERTIRTDYGQYCDVDHPQVRRIMSALHTAGYIVLKVGAKS